MILVDFYNYCEFIMLVVNDFYYWKKGYWVKVNFDGIIERGMVVFDFI